MPSPWSYALSLSLPVSAVLGAVAGGVFTFATAVYVMAGLAVVDLVLGEDPSNPPADDLDGLASRAGFRIVLYAYAVAHLAALAAVLAFVNAHGATWIEIVGISLSLGVAGGVCGFPVAHELMHKRGPLGRGLGRSLLVPLCYLHMHIEHINHHALFGTDRDASTARYGESAYRFFLRTLPFKLRVAWEVEERRLSREGRSAWSPRNEVLWAVVLPVAIATALGVAAGAQVLACFLGQAFVAILLFEVAAYFEHYGLERIEVAPGRYERFGPQHSWDTYHRASDCVLFRLQRHADHHARASSPYQTLRSAPGSRKLPTGYLGSAVLALIPPLWFRVVHPRMDRPASAGD